LEKIKTYEAVTKPTETPQNVLSSFTYYNRIDVAPDTKAARLFTEHMKKVWLRNYDKDSTILEFNFHPSESELVDFYDTAPPESRVTMGLILPMDFAVGDSMPPIAHLNYTIRTSPDEVMSLPSLSTKKMDLDTCRAKRDSTEIGTQLEYPTTCPINGYYYSNFLALQSLVDQTFLELVTGKQVNLTLTVENYPKAEYTAGRFVSLRVIFQKYSITFQYITSPTD